MIAAIASPRSSNSAVEAVDVVVLTQEGVGRRPLGHARAVGEREREHAAAGGRQEGVGVAVVAAVELDDLLAAGVAAGEADGAHRRLGAGVHHAHHLDRRHGLADEAGELDLDGRRRAEARAVVEDGVQPAEHVRVAPAEDHRPPRRDEVDVLVAVDVPDVGALGARDEERVGMPTPFNARTGELTPPGMYLSASSYRRADVSSFTRSSIPFVHFRLATILRARRGNAV